MTDISVTVATKVDHDLNPHIDDEVIASWIEGRLNDGRNLFITSMGSGPGHSAPGAYPNQQTGALAGSVDSEMAGPREGHLFSDIEYAAYLTTGTSKMAKRKMLWEAFQEVMESRPDTDELAQAVQITGGS
jgi:hypothetical protein